MNETLNGVTMFLIGYFSGFISGIVFSYLRHRKNKDVANNDIVLLSVTMVWTLTRLTSLINTSINISPALDVLMGGLVGYFYKGEIPFIKKKEDEKNVGQN